MKKCNECNECGEEIEEKEEKCKDCKINEQIKRAIEKYKERNK